METWPISLQQLLNTVSFQLQVGDTVTRTAMGVGLDKLRSRYTDGVDVYTSTINMDKTLYSTFKDFYKTTLNNGTKTFAFNEPLSGTSMGFRFAAAPLVVPLGGTVFQVTMKWEKIP